jgi:hypothetical protein
MVSILKFISLLSLPNCSENIFCENAIHQIKEDSLSNFTCNDVLEEKDLLFSNRFSSYETKSCKPIIYGESFICSSNT